MKFRRRSIISVRPSYTSRDPRFPLSPLARSFSSDFSVVSKPFFITITSLRNRPTSFSPLSLTFAAMSGADRGRDILNELLNENAAYIAGASKPQSILAPAEKRRQLAARGQKPVAAVIACADSRVAPEIVFGSGLGHVFVIRNAGNVCWGDSVIGSLEYAVAALKVPLVIVLGHSLCGAVTAAVNAGKGELAAAADSQLQKHIDRIAQVVRPVVGAEEEVKEAVLHNVKEGVKLLRTETTTVAAAYAAGDIAIVGAVYDLHSGKVAIVEEKSTTLDGRKSCFCC